MSRSHRKCGKSVHRGNFVLFGAAMANFHYSCCVSEASAVLYENPVCSVTHIVAVAPFTNAACTTVVAL
jgi:hypothetical protein